METNQQSAPYPPRPKKRSWFYEFFAGKFYRTRNIDHTAKIVWVKRIGYVLVGFYYILYTAMLAIVILAGLKYLLN